MTVLRETLTQYITFNRGRRGESAQVRPRTYILHLSLCSVADPRCLSRIPDPDFYPSRIPDPGSRIPNPKTAAKERGEKKLVVMPFYVATNFTKLKIILILKC